MIEILNPDIKDIPRLRALWKEAFSDDNGYFDFFSALCFSPRHTLVLKEKGEILSALYILDCEYKNRKIGYIYAVATDEAHRGRGFASRLLKFSDGYLKAHGYSAAILRPASEKLFDYYKNLGYDTLLKKYRFEAAADGYSDITKISADEYARRRTAFLPLGAVLQPTVQLSLFESYAKFYMGDGFLLAAEERNGALYAAEFLGDCEKAPQIVAALGFEKGIFNTVGSSVPFALLKNFDLEVLPDYFGIALE